MPQLPSGQWLWMVVPIPNWTGPLPKPGARIEDGDEAEIAAFRGCEPCSSAFDVSDASYCFDMIDDWDAVCGDYSELIYPGSGDCDVVEYEDDGVYMAGQASILDEDGEDEPDHPLNWTASDDVTPEAPPCGYEAP